MNSVIKVRLVAIEVVSCGSLWNGNIPSKSVQSRIESVSVIESVATESGFVSLGFVLFLFPFPVCYVLSSVPGTSPWIAVSFSSVGGRDFSD